MWKEIIKENLIGAIAGGLVVWYFPKLMSLSISMMFVPSSILGYVGKGLSVILGAIVGGLIQMLIVKNQRKN
jgi:hypothetical protein